MSQPLPEFDFERFIYGGDEREVRFVGPDEKGEEICHIIFSLPA